ncbi:MAG: AAA family ATPase [Anaerovoracaceae bacterium]
MSLIFKKIENGNIFTRDFSPLVRNGEITFPTSEEIAVIYGPNGTGKTSLIKVLDDSKNTKVEFSLDGIDYQAGNGIFHIINDQNNRNIISGETRDFFLGDNIRHEFELQEQVVLDRNVVISAILSLIKNTFGISAGNSPLIELLSKADLAAFIKDCANSKSKGNQYTTDNLVALFNSLETKSVPEYSPEKLAFAQNDLMSKQSIIRQLELLIGTEIAPNVHVQEIEENTEAIGILSRFHKSKCIVCDNDDIDWESLLVTKTACRQATLDALETKVRAAIEKTIPFVPTSDPFGIKPCLLTSITNGNTDALEDLCRELSIYKSLYSTLLENGIVELVNESELIAHHSEYQHISAERPDIADEDYLYIQEIISNSMSKPLTIERDDNRRLRIYLSNQEFLNKARDELPLSTGEQNFLSLTFEFLKAKNSECPIVVIDDPVSSFDSIYKNKVAYAIVKMLHHKKRIILTHNTDLIRLLDGQYKRCFKLYLLNNTDGELNGFIPLKNNEQEMLISLEKLLTAFRESIPRHVINPELFLISMIPFMRGYANIICNKPLFETLTQVMHGYKIEKVDIARAYSDLFGEHYEYLPSSCQVSVTDILSKTVDSVHLLNTEIFPLLDRTLRHSFVYLFLRLMVEKNLVEKFGIDTIRNEQLGQIIAAAYPDETNVDQIRNRIRLTSKKTLINEFNHFEGNLSIFQPAIDITDQALGKERTDLTTFISSL